MSELLDDLFRAANDRVRAIDAGPDAHYFFCECADPHCFRPVPLDSLAYDEARRTGTVLYAPDCPLRPVAEGTAA